MAEHQGLSKSHFQILVCNVEPQGPLLLEGLLQRPMGNPLGPIEIDSIFFHSLTLSVCKLGASHMIICVGP